MANDYNDSAAVANSAGLSRRQFLRNAALGGTAIAVTAVGGAAVGALSRTDLEDELNKLRALVGLYEQLERFGLDTLISNGMGIIRGALDTVKAGVGLIRNGIGAAENALKAFLAFVDTLRGAVNGVAQILNDLTQKFQAAEGVVTAALGNAAPLAQSIGDFFNSVLGLIPFGVGDNMRRALTALTDLIRAIPASIEAVTTQVFKPLRDWFFPATGEPLVRTNLVNPIINNVLEPNKKLLADLETLLQKWENDFTKPVQSALDDRARVRKQIVALKESGVRLA